VTECRGTERSVSGCSIPLGKVRFVQTHLVPHTQRSAPDVSRDPIPPTLASRARAMAPTRHLFHGPSGFVALSSVVGCCRFRSES
jgi:hypothetical protein